MLTEYEKLLQSEEGRLALCEEHAILSVTEMICELLGKHGMTRKEFAKKLGVSPARVTQILDGEANMTLQTIARSLLAFDQVLEVSSKSLEDHRTHCVWTYHAEAWSERKADQDRLPIRMSVLPPFTKMVG